jgi:hypothetical protein
MPSTYYIGTSPEESLGDSPRYFYGLRCNDQGELFFVRSDQLADIDDVVINQPGSLVDTFQDFEAGVDYFDGIDSEHEILYENMKYPQYKWDNRSSDLLKYKKFQDQEFEVIGVKAGKGKFEGLAVFICKNDLNDETFEVTIATDFKTKKEQFDNRDSYIGKKLTVKYFDRTDKLIPTFPVGLAFRLEEDLA